MVSSASFLLSIAIMLLLIETGGDGGAKDSEISGCSINMALNCNLLSVSLCKRRCKSADIRRGYLNYSFPFGRELAAEGSGLREEKQRLR
jgi:hypothetical protein